MKVTLKIARQELETLFFSPIAWIILIIFSIQCGVSFTDKLAIFEASQYGGSPMSQLTIYLFSSGSSFFAQLQKYLYLYIPLVTMGLMSRETSSGTIKLLFSSPVKLSSIIFGKYLSMMVYGLLLTLFIVFICLGGIYSVENIDMGMLFCGVLGLYLLICAYAAIGLYMSCLTSYQMIAALSTLVVLGVLSYIGGVWQNIAFIRDITYFLSINGRAGHMFFGLISSKDIIYFVIVIGLFLTLAIMKLQNDRHARGSYASAIRYIVVVSVILLIGYASSSPSLTFYADLSANKSNTLTKTSQDMIDKLDGPMKLTSYVNILDDGSYMAMPANQLNDMERFESYVRFKPDLEMEYVYYYDQPLNRRAPEDGRSLEERAKRKAEAEDMDFDKILSPSEIRRLIDLRPESNRFVRQLTYGNKKTFLRMFDDPEMYPSEVETTVALKRLMVKPPKVGFVSGHDEPNIVSDGEPHYSQVVSYSGSRSSLINMGYDVMDISLQKEIPADADVLILTDPRSALDAIEIERIHQFIEKGGSMMIAGEPGRQAFINQVISPLGLKMKPGMVIQDTQDLSVNYVLGRFAPGASAIPDFSRTASFNNPVALPGAVALSYQPDGKFKASALLLTDTASNWIRTAPLVGDSLRLRYNAAIGDQKGVFPLAYALNRTHQGKDQRILVIGDANFFSNGEIFKSNVPKANFPFIQNVFHWLSLGHFPVDVSRPMPDDNLLKISRRDVSVMKMIYMGVIPVLIGLSGATLLLRRRRN